MPTFNPARRSLRPSIPRPAPAERRGKPRVIVAVAILLASFLATATTPANAVIIASDTATNDPPYTPGGSILGLDGGTGFGTWAGVAGSGTSGTATRQGTNFVTDVSNAVTSAGYELVRPFDLALQDNDTFTVGSMVGGASGAQQNSLLLGNGTTTIFQLLADPLGGTTWLYNDGTGSSVDTGIQFGTSANFSFTQLSTSTYSFTLTGTGTPYSSGTRTLLNSLRGDRVVFGSVSDGSTTPLASMTFDTIQITAVPEPHACSLTVSALAGIAALVARRRVERSRGVRSTAGGDRLGRRAPGHGQSP